MIHGVPAAYAAESAASDVISERIVIDTGHVDAIAPRMVDGKFRTLFKDSRTASAVWREPGSVIMHLTSKGKQTIPDPADGLSFLGNAGDTFYSIPQTQDPEVLWAGWSTEAFQNSDIQGNFTLSLDKVEGPGGLLLFEWTPFGEPMMRFDSRDGLPDAYEVPARTHEHANWVFTKEGVYRMTFTFRATLPSGQEVSDSQVFTMAVGDVNPDEVQLPGDEDPGGSTDGGSTDGGSSDGGASDGGSTDGGSTDGGSTDGGSTDGGSTDGGSTDGGSTDGGSTDGGSTDGGSTDGGSTDGGSTDGGSTDGGSTDGGSTDGGSTDGGSTDGGPTDGGSTDGGSSDGGSTDGGSTDGASSGGGLAETGAGAAIPLGLSGAALLGAGAGTAVFLHRRKTRGMPETTPDVTS
ncbi:choice-of-anchor M domain-containing protein [Actinacidiphila glaucinigra]|uniref:choice-of-anchor M domain-containing protein n=1 Tax=Actinacidiphila glaucinigra TaxID=235986 RepID=UPI0033B38B5F